MRHGLTRFTFRLDRQYHQAVVMLRCGRVARIPPVQADGFDIFTDPDEAVLLAERAAKANGLSTFRFQKGCIHSFSVISVIRLH